MSLLLVARSPPNRRWLNLFRPKAIGAIRLFLDDRREILEAGASSSRPYVWRIPVVTVALTRDACTQRFP